MEHIDDHFQEVAFSMGYRPEDLLPVDREVVAIDSAVALKECRSDRRSSTSTRRWPLSCSARTRYFRQSRWRSRSDSSPTNCRRSISSDSPTRSWKIFWRNTSSSSGRTRSSSTLSSRRRLSIRWTWKGRGSAVSRRAGRAIVLAGTRVRSVRRAWGLSAAIGAVRPIGQPGRRIVF